MPRWALHRRGPDQTVRLRADAGASVLSSSYLGPAGRTPWAGCNTGELNTERLTSRVTGGLQGAWCFNSRSPDLL